MQSRCKSLLIALSVVAAGSFSANALAQSDAGGQPADGGSSMSERIKKYMPEDGGDPALPGNEGMASRRERIREKLRNMPEEQRQRVMERMRQRGKFGSGMEPGLPAGEGGPPGRFHESMPPGGGPPPGEGGLGRFREGWNGEGPPGEGGPGRFRAGKGVRNFDRGAARGGMKSGGKWIGRGPLDLTVLNLTEEQKTRIQTMRTANSQKAKKVQSQLRQRRAKLQDMLFDPSASQDQIKATHSEIRKLRNQAEDIMIDDFLGIRGMLTKEQMQLLPQVRPEPQGRSRRQAMAGGAPGMMARKGPPPGPPGPPGRPQVGLPDGPPPGSEFDGLPPQEAMPPGDLDVQSK